MKSNWRILVLALAIVSLIAPLPATVKCPSLVHADHGCCAAEIQLSAPSCCHSDVSSQTAVAAQADFQTIAERASSPRGLSLSAVEPSARFNRSLIVSPLILQPQTILRT
jgi:hypothetical protein